VLTEFADPEATETAHTKLEFYQSAADSAIWSGQAARY
jgi:hypothetical protein